MESTAGLRERKKAETRQAVHEAALRLCAEHGLDNVTVEAIADAANISRRTFSNYFAGKEDALLYGDEQRIRLLVERVRSRPPEEPAWQALRGAVRDLYGELGEPEVAWAVRARLAKRHPALLARQLANHAALERELVQAITDRDGTADPVRPRVLAAGFLVALRIATHMWTDEQEPRPLHEVMKQVLDHMEAPF
ncbi:TetR/AcrR family transcriptional regulator [Streptosporangium saharense]|uniref:AcrR family transcriptional regulator n=1 Tax=Streptosporangium saharense TaxID=1706840 RepID=A0A7W7QVE2_9ACTN|nr:TetR/AcrR family transcriptional regulator [Streptosporangium saharense]MBB4920405.1 AcrR family transcriptional regulator [Streptosporangium saharense]